MNKIVKYELISVKLGVDLSSAEITEDDFTKLVNKKIESGFQPYGELRISVETSGSFLGSGSTTRLSQVMVKYEE